MKIAYTLLIFSIISGAILPQSASARQEIDSADRLSFLNRATGNDSGDNTFQRRVDAIMNTETSTNRDFVGTRDEQVRVEAQQQLLEQQEAAMLRLHPPAERKPDEEIPKIGGKIKPDPFSDGMERKMQDGSNQAFDRSTSKIYEEDDKRKAAASQIAVQDKTVETDSAGKPGNLAPSLANNPFYIAPEATTARSFADDKPILISRLIEKGLVTQQAEEMVRNASSREEIVVMLMRDLQWTYGESSEVTDVPPAESSESSLI